jgi:hypothetical protein
MKSVTCGSTGTSSDGSGMPNAGTSECGCAVEPGRSTEIVSAPFVEGQVDTPVGPIPRVKTSLEPGDVFGGEATGSTLVFTRSGIPTQTRRSWLPPTTK